MKKIYLGIALLLSIVTGSFAQSTFGVKGGLNLASESARLDNQSATTKMAPRFHLTAYYDASISPKFSIQPGISLEGKGGKSEIEGETLTDKLLYLQIPVNFLGRIQSRTGDFFFGGGPYIAYGIDAKVTSGRNALHLEWGSNSDQLQPFDAGVGLNLGYRFLNGLVLNISSSVGFVNISNQDGAKYLNRVSSIGIGYEFLKRK